MSEDYLFSEGILVFQLKAECDSVGLRKFCRKHDLDHGNVSKIINGNRPMTEKVAAVMGYTPVLKWLKVRK